MGCHKSGIYKVPDSAIFLSGMGQTTFGILDLEEQEELEREMLTLLGLTHVPENAAHKVNRMRLLITQCRDPTIYRVVHLVTEYSLLTLDELVTNG